MDFIPTFGDQGIDFSNYVVPKMKSIREILPRASQDCIDLNPLPQPKKPKKTRSMGIGGGCEGYFDEIITAKTNEINHQRKIQDSEQREQTPALGSEGKGEASGARCPLIGFTLYRVKLLDWEAKYSSVKDLLDGCVSAGLLDGDREDQIHPNSYVRQVKVKSYAEERTVIEIEL